jgi:uncharacterized cofD-like protein
MGLFGLRIRLNNKYFLPGIKRWIFALIFGITFIALGSALLLELRPLTKISSTVWNVLRWVADLMPAHISGPLILICGIGAIVVSLIYMVRTMIDVTVSESSSMSGKPASQSVLKALERASKRGQGPKIVAIGGGTGLSTLLRGIKSYSNNITAIVTVGDDGGSSGRLREELKVVPPGDIRNCIVALSSEEEVTTSLFQYRFSEGSLKGHNLGNLFLAALCELSGDMAKATQVASRILRSEGKVLPSSLEAVSLCAEMNDGTIISGESKIPESDQKIKRIFANYVPPLLKDCEQAIKDADLIILGPGSLYTSIIPNFLFPSLTEAVKKSKAKVLYICNLVQDRETRNYSVSDFVKAIQDHSTKNIVDAVLINAPESWNLEKGHPVPLDLDELNKLSVEVIVRSKLQDSDGRHNPLRLARSIFQWFTLKQNSKELTNSVNSNKNMVISN